MNNQNSLVAQANDGNFISLKDSSAVLLVMFGAAWCPACKMMEPVITELAHEQEGSVKVAKADVAASPNITAQYGIRNIPALLIFKNDQLQHRYIGVTPKKKIADDLSSLFSLDTSSI